MSARGEPLGDAAMVDAVLADFDLGRALELRGLGGTAARKWAVRTAQGRFVVRRRPDEFADPGSVGFDHAVMRRLAAAGFPVPCPAAAADGRTAAVRGDGTYEVLCWIEGEPFREGDPEALRELGIFLARFHQELAGEIPPGKEGRLREDHPDLLQPYLAAVQTQASDAGQRQQLAALAGQLSLVRRQLDQRLYDSLPRAVIHGDFHPGNVRFRGPRVAALYDFDYLGVQARARDIADAVMFFASHRRQPLVADDIRELTRAFVPDAARCVPLLAGYESVTPLIAPEWEALGWLIRSRWLQARLRGSRKVSAAEKVQFVLSGLFEVVAWLDGPGTGFFQHLRRECRRT